jgi:hypothetical protein
MILEGYNFNHSTPLRVFTFAHDGLDLLEHAEVKARGGECSHSPIKNCLPKSV